MDAGRHAGGSLMSRVSEWERDRRWRLVLGAEAEDADGQRAAAAGLSVDDRRLDGALGALYDQRPAGSGRSRGGGLGASKPAVARWLGDIRRYFPASVVQVLQRDAIERLDLRQLLFEPELLAGVQPDVHLAALLVELNRLLPDETRATARQVVRTVVDQLTERLAERTRQATLGALARSQRSRRPRPADIDWLHTVQANLAHYQPQYRTVIPERLVGYGRRQRSLARDVVVAIDQSGSMADSVVYAGVFGSVLAALPALRTAVIGFDTEVTDLTALAADPVDVLFGVQLGGGTDIARALGYCQQLVTRPTETVVVLVSDLFEGGDVRLLEARAAALVRAGVTVVALVTLSDDGAPAYDHGQVQRFAALGIPSLACTPDAFPDLFAAALERRELIGWADARPGVVAVH